MELTIKEKFDLTIPKDKVDFLKKFYEMKARAKVYEEEINMCAEQFLTENDLLEEGYQQDSLKIIRTKNYKKKFVDTQKLKEEGLYDLYTKEVEVEGHIKVSFEYED